MKTFSQTFVKYHGCGNGYLEGTNKIVPEGRNALCQHRIHFGKIQYILQTKSQNQQDHKLKRKQKQKNII